MSTSRQTEIEIKQVPIGELRPDPANPRRISDQELEALTRSIREFGFIDPIIARKEDRMVIGGHQRLLAARRLGYETVPVVFVDLSQEQARLLNIALNKISGSFDQELLARLLKELNDVPDLDITLSGFEEDELKNLLKSLDAREKRDQAENFDLEEALKAARSATVAQRGDIWLLGQTPAHVRRCDRP
jgi:ParB-like chromosome segregation protein Spo0J